MDTRSKTDLAIFVHSLDDLDLVQLQRWLRPLLGNSLGSIPIFEARHEDEFAYLVRVYECRNVIIANTKLLETMTHTPISQLICQIRCYDFLGMPLQALLLPDPMQIDWHLLEPALDRFEELL